MSKVWTINVIAARGNPRRADVRWLLSQVSADCEPIAHLRAHVQIGIG